MRFSSSPFSLKCPQKSEARLSRQSGLDDFRFETSRSFLNCSKNEQIDERLVFLQTFDNIGSKEIERLITGSSKSPDLKTGITFVMFHDRAKEPVANDMLKKRVIIGNDTGKRSFKNSRGYFIHTRGFIPGQTLNNLFYLRFSCRTFFMDVICPAARQISTLVEKPSSLASCIALSAVILPTDE